MRGREQAHGCRAALKQQTCAGPAHPQLAQRAAVRLLRAGVLAHERIVLAVAQLQQHGEAVHVGLRGAAVPLRAPARRTSSARCRCAGLMSAEPRTVWLPCLQAEMIAAHPSCSHAQGVAQPESSWAPAAQPDTRRAGA